jgi:glycosyltransferase involved in cell wall biosynthesis
VVRTQGTRPETFRDALLCLQGQTLPDFEVLVAVHRATAEAQADVERAVAELPRAMRSRLRVLTVPDGGRARPLNEAFAVAHGRYVAVLDDDDVVFAPWVEAFADAAADAPGSVLRAVSMEQPIEPAEWGGHRPGLLVTGAMTQPYPQTFDLIDHMARNHTPFMAYAFPRALFRDLGLRFDETLDICEDWDFSLRAALLAGVTSVPSVTAVYRRWETGSSSYSLHVAAEWRRTEQSILDKVDDEPHVFPAGTIGAIREATTRAERRVERDMAALKERNTELEEHSLRMERSASWRLTAPLRAIRNRGRRGP